MKTCYDDGQVQVYPGDALEALKQLSAQIVDCVATSPPYLSKRKYAGEQELVWGGDDHCRHQWGPEIIRRDRGKAENSDVVRQPRELIGTTTSQGSFCQLCDAWKGAYGEEPSPEMYIEHSLLFLREIKRVLKKTGVVWWNIGDSYWGSGGAVGHTDQTLNLGRSTASYNAPVGVSVGQKHPTIKPLDLCLIPQRLAILAQNEGWYIRSIVIWGKKNPMPESLSGWRWEKHKVTQCPKCQSLSSFKRKICQACGYEKRETMWADCSGCSRCLPNDGYVLRKGSWRPTTSHEYILMLAKSGGYYADGEGVREAYTEPLDRWGGDTLKRDTSKTAEHKEMQNIGYASAFRVGRIMRPNEDGRNLRSVWEFPTEPHSSPHFAVFPSRLPEICILSSTPDAGVCSNCGKPWVRVIESKSVATRVANGEYKTRDPERHIQSTKTLAWRPSCKCDAPSQPALVLDPFCGTGTTLWAAKKLGRHAIGIDISEGYCQMAVESVRQLAMELRHL